MHQQNGFFLALFLFVLFSPARADLREIEPADLETMIEQGVPVIDVRTSAEWNSTGVIPSSHKLTFFRKDGQYNSQQWLTEFKKIVSDPDQEFVLVCHSGNRTRKIGQFLADKIGLKNVSHLEHGIMSWIQQDKPITR